MHSIPYGRQKTDYKDLKFIKRSIFQELITKGKYVQLFEKEIQSYLNTNYAYTCSSGTAALHLAFLSINLKKGDNIIMPAINFVAAYNMAKLVGANVFLSDVDPISGQMTPENLIKCIKKNKIRKVKAFLTMYLGGNPENIPIFYNLKKKFKCFFIEDACHALGSEYYLNKKFFKVGCARHSDISVFSLHPLKTITSGEGGIITTNVKSIAKKIPIFRSHGLIRNKKYYWKTSINVPGFNYRLSDINCALGLSQLKKIKYFLKKRNLIAKYYIKNLNKYKNYFIIPSHNIKNRSAWHLFLININFSKLKKNKDFFINYLNRNKILPQFHYVPIYRLNIKNVFNKKDFVGCESYYNTALSLPIFVDLNIIQQNFIINKLVNFINKFKLKN